MISARQDGEHYHEHVEALRRGEHSDRMRIMRTDMPDDCPRYIRMDALNEEWADRNHGQTLRRLNERGGLGPSEAAAIIEKRRWHPMLSDDAIAVIREYEVK